MGTFKYSGGVEIIGFISPTDPSDQYPVIDPLYGIDGFRNVNTLSDLNNIPDLRRRAGMVVGVSGGTTYYKLNPSPWVGNISDWSLFQTGGGGSVSGEYLPLSGGTVTGGTNFTSGLTANTISATTYQNLPTDVRVTGGTYSSGTATFTNNTGGTFSISGFSTASTFTGGTVSGQTNFTNGLTANTISATTYQNLPVSGLTEGNNINISGSNGNYSISVTGVTGGSTFTGGTVSGATNFTNGLTANTISGGTYVGDGSQLNVANPSTGTTITFTAGTIYNSPTSAATGNISADTTNAKIGIVQKIYHNDSVAPTFNPSGWIKLGIGIYTTSTLNVIYAEWVSGSRIEYWIVKGV